MGRCENCQFWVVDEPGDRIGECRRYPPVVYSGISERDSEEGLDIMDYESILIRSVYPVTSSALGCGEYAKADRPAPH